MGFITVTSIGGSVWSFNKDRIEMVIKRFSFTESELKDIPKLANLDSCAIIHLIGSEANYYCLDSYESIMQKMEE